MDDPWAVVEPCPEPYPFQSEVIAAVRAHVAAGRRRVLIQSSTGSGKTVIASLIIRSCVGLGRRALFLAHARELVNQASRKLRSLGVPHGVIMAGRPLYAAPVQVASKDTLLARAVRGSSMGLPPADLLVADECHHTASKWWQILLGRYPRAVALGLTATPSRGDGKGLAPFWQAMVCAAPPSRLLAEGRLVPTVAYAPWVPDLKGVPTSQGDYARGALERRMDRPELVGNVVEHWKRLAADRLTLVFASGIGHSQHLCESFKAEGVPAAHVEGGTDPEERDRVVSAFARGDLRVLCSCNVFTEGTDIPAADCAVLARPTKSLVRYLQSSGRIQRPYPGKKDALLLDHAGCVLRHGFPDEDREWVLTAGRAVAALPPGERPAAVPHTCPRCFFVFGGRRDCPQCGALLPSRRAEPVRHRDGHLREVARGREKPAPGTPQEMQRYWGKALAVMAHKGQDARGAAGMFRGKFGVPPWGHVSPMPQGEEWRVPVAELYPAFGPRRPAETYPGEHHHA